MIALATIFALDWIISTLTGRSERAARVLEGDPVPLARDGVLRRDAMRRSRISESQLLERVRERGGESLAQLKDAFLERSGRITVVLHEGR